MARDLVARLEEMIEELDSAGFKVSVAYVQMAIDCIAIALDEDQVAGRVSETTPGTFSSYQ